MEKFERTDQEEKEKRIREKIERSELATDGEGYLMLGDVADLFFVQMDTLRHYVRGNDRGDNVAPDCGSDLRFKDKFAAATEKDYAQLMIHMDDAVKFIARFDAAHTQKLNV
jgi:alpha-amylase/alpha-mannosidase (GH57 family)